jgi:hypothetical protein
MAGWHRTAIPWNTRARRQLAGKRRAAVILRITSGTCATFLVASALLLILAAYGDIMRSRLWEEYLDTIPEPGPPAPGDYYAWSKPGSPMDCLVNSRQARLSVYFEHLACFSTGHGFLEITVARTTTITGDGRWAREARVPERSFHVEGLPAEQGMLHFLDFIGASQRPETESDCASTTYQSVRLTFACDGEEKPPISFDTRCPGLWDYRLKKSLYVRALGLIDVAGSIMTSAVSQGSGG